jgi:hypothetical protein
MTTALAEENASFMAPVNVAVLAPPPMVVVPE